MRNRDVSFTYEMTVENEERRIQGLYRYEEKRKVREGSFRKEKSM